MKKLINTVVKAVLIPMAFGMTCLRCTMSPGGTQTETGAGVVAEKSRLDELKQMWNHYSISGQHQALIDETRPEFYEFVRNGDTMEAMYSGVSIAQAWMMLENGDSVERYLEMIRPFERKNDDAMLGIFLNNVAGSYALTFSLDYAEAFNRFKAAYEWAEKCGDIGNRIIMLANIVQIFYVRSDRYGMTYAEEAMALAGNDDVDIPCKTIAHTAMAQMCCLNRQYEKTLEHLNEAILLSERSGYTMARSAIMLLYADTYNALGRYDDASECYLEAVKSPDVLQPTMASLIYLNYGKFCEEHSEYGRAIYLYEEGLAWSRKFGNTEFRRELLWRLSDIYSRKGNMPVSLDYYKMYRDHLDNIDNEEREKEFNALMMSLREMEHQTQMQAKELELLRSERKMEITWTVSGLVVMVLVFGWLLYARKQKTDMLLVKQHQNYMQQLDTEETLERVSASGSDQSEVRLFRQLEDLMRSEKIYRNKDLSLDRIAEMLGTNRTYVSKAINNVAGTTYYNYLNIYRIREATRILSEAGDIQMKQLSDDLGYNTLSVFYNAFRSEVGCTPGQYRSKVRELNRDRKK
ncbi:MAG TPA: helix-turn-helix domain-containing protein [Candidatus Coprenecus stercoravium]|uniref:Helix-turn-helix domain-containing protein n=1 Tax=Candidatus Coprenecus stercoravium TaxID=2840735 RepID=A0A9D2GRB8_9BACT|nr:helix-turn-helix domain-containing protein [Candidatus Coprenecus stercoravium]